MSADGISLFIQSTLAVATPTFPYGPTNSNVNSPFSVNVYVVFPSLFVTTVPSLSNVIVTVTSSFVSSVISYVKLAFGNVLHIQSTSAIAVPSFPYGPLNSNVNSPFSVNVYLLLPSLFSISTSSLTSPFTLNFTVTVTSLFVGSDISYSNIASGNVLQIQSTSAIAFPLFPSPSSNSNVNVPFSVNVYVVLPLLFNTVISVLGFTNVTTTS